MTVEPNDPTRSGSPLPEHGSGSIALSCNEVETLCLKAARAAGMSWGLAEEAGFAAAWLATHGIDGPAALLGHLERMQGNSWEEAFPLVAKGQWQAKEGQLLCPVALGAALCDFAALPQGLPARGELVAGPASYPVLTLPFLADIARRSGQEITADWGSGSSRLTPEGFVAGATEALADMETGTLIITATAYQGRSGEQRPMAQIDHKTLAGLNVFAMKTTVPGSEQSRAGAGAGTSDND